MQQVARYGSEVPEFTWIKGKKVVRLRTYNIYEITPRTILNENNEQATYKRPYHVVKQGDTWEIIELDIKLNSFFVSEICSFCLIIISLPKTL